MAIKIDINAKDSASTEFSKLTLSVSETSRALATANPSADKFTESVRKMGEASKGTSEKIKEIFKTIKSLGVVFDTLGKSFNIMKKFADAAGEAQFAQQKFRNEVERAGLSWDTVGKKSNEFIKSMQRVSRFSDEELQDSLRTGVRLFNDYNQAQRITALTMDMSAATGKTFASTQMDARRVMEGLLKGTQGSAAALERYDHTIAETAMLYQQTMSPAAALEAVMGLLEAKFKGAAKDDLSNYDSAVVRLEHSWRNVVQLVGSALLPAFTSVVNFLTRISFSLADAIEQSSTFQRITEFFKNLGAAADQAFDKLEPTIIESLMNLLDALGDAVLRVIGAFLGIDLSISSISSKSISFESIINGISDSIVGFTEILIGVINITKTVFIPVFSFLGDVLGFLAKNSEVLIVSATVLGGAFLYLVIAANPVVLVVAAIIAAIAILWPALKAIAQIIAGFVVVSFSYLAQVILLVYLGLVKIGNYLGIVSDETVENAVAAYEWAGSLRNAREEIEKTNAASLNLGTGISGATTRIENNRNITVGGEIKNNVNIEMKPVRVGLDDLGSKLTNGIKSAVSDASKPASDDMKKSLEDTYANIQETLRQRSILESQ